MPSISVSGDLSKATAAADYLQVYQVPAATAVAKRPSIATTNAAAVAATAAVASGRALPSTSATAPTAAADADADTTAAAVAAAFTPLKSLLPLHAELTQLCWLGSGSGGRVYSGLWRGSPVAVKILVSSTPDEVRESVREAMLNRVASHPHMVQCFAAFSGYLMMEDVAPRTRRDHTRGPAATGGEQQPKERERKQERERLQQQQPQQQQPRCWSRGPDSPAPPHSRTSRQPQQQHPQHQPRQQKPRPCDEHSSQQDVGQAPPPHSSRPRAPSCGSASSGAGRASPGPRSAHRPPSPYDSADPAAAGSGNIGISGGGGVSDEGAAAGGFRRQSLPAAVAGAGAWSGVRAGAGYGLDERGSDDASAIIATIDGAGVELPADPRASFCSYCGAEATTCVCEGPGSERRTPDGDAVTAAAGSGGGCARSDGRSGTGGGGGGRGRYVKYAAARAASGGGGLEFGDAGGGDGGCGAGTGPASPSCSFGHKPPSQWLSMGRSGSCRSLRALARAGSAAIAMPTACPELHPNAGIAQGQFSAPPFKTVSALCLGLETAAAAAACVGSTGVGSSSNGGPCSPYSGSALAFDRRSLSLVNLGGASAARANSRTTLTLSDLMGSVALDEHSVSAGELWEVLGATGAQPGRHITLVVMELCDQGTLQQAMQRQQFSAVRSAEQCSALVALLRTALEVAQGMCHLHSLDIVHGDLKPSNVLLQSNASIASRVAGWRRWEQDHRGYTAKVADFGIAAVQSESCSSAWRSPVQDSGHPERHWGSLPFMAPEVPERGPKKKSDVWAFGMLLYYMCCGRVPYASYSNLRPAQVMMGIVEGSLHLDWPDDTYRLLRRLSETCCQRSPADRPPFTRIVSALQRLIRHVCENPEPVSSTVLGVRAAAAAAGGGAASSSSSSTGARLGGGAARVQGGGSSYSLSLSSLRGGGDGCSHELAMRLVSGAKPARARTTEALQACGEMRSSTAAVAAAPSTEHVPSPLTMFARCLMVPPALSVSGAIGAPRISSPGGDAAAAASAVIPLPTWQSSGMERSSMCMTEYSAAVDPDLSSFKMDPAAVGRAPCRGSNSAPMRSYLSP